MNNFFRSIWYFLIGISTLNGITFVIRNISKYWRENPDERSSLLSGLAIIIFVIWYFIDDDKENKEPSSH